MRQGDGTCSTCGTTKEEIINYVLFIIAFFCIGALISMFFILFSPKEPTSRTITIYDNTGNEIFSYYGNFCIETVNNNCIKFDKDGKSTYYYNCSAIVREN